MNWNDLRYVLAVARTGSLLAAGRELEVDHTTVGRRIEAAERSLGIRLFLRTTTGYVLTADAERLVAPLRRVEEAVHDVARSAQTQDHALAGSIRVTSPETLGASYLAARLAEFRQAHPKLQVELMPGGEVLDLARRAAEVAIRTFATRADGIAVRRVAEVRYGFYASAAYLKRCPLRSPADLANHAVLGIPPGSNEVEARWLERLAPGVAPVFSSPVSAVLLEAARADGGVAILPRYLGDAERKLRHVAMPHPPAESLWLTVHRDLRGTPRVRALLDFLHTTMTADAAVFRGA